MAVPMWWYFMSTSPTTLQTCRDSASGSVCTVILKQALNFPAAVSKTSYDSTRHW